MNGFITGRLFVLLVTQAAANQSQLVVNFPPLPHPQKRYKLPLAQLAQLALAELLSLFFKVVPQVNQG